ncbi:unnamed protein product [Diamesa serratosioi]
MADKSKTHEYYVRPVKLGAWKGFTQFMWNSETSQFMGRTGPSWAKILLFYLAFYTVLTAFFMSYWFIFASTLTNAKPKWELSESIIGTNPGLGFRPMPPEDNDQSTLIWYQYKNANNSDFWTNSLDEFLERKKNDYKYYLFWQLLLTMTDYLILEYDQEDSNQVECNNQKPPAGKSCKVNLDSFSTCTKKQNYQFQAGKPCVFLKLNKIFNWQPDLYDDLASLPQNMPVSLKDHIGAELKKKDNTSTIWVSCEGENPADVENLGTDISYYSINDLQGFPGYFFPFVNTKGYLQPLVAVAFKSVKKGVLINIECKAWAKNIKHDRADRRGSVHFELMIDEPKA